MSVPADHASEAAVAIAERRRGLAAAISSATVFGVGIGLAGPLLSLLLEARGTDARLTGLNAAATFIGVILGPLLTPASVRRMGIRSFLLLCLALDVGFFLLLKVFDDIISWFVLRMVLGTVGSAMFTATEAWINLLAEGRSRGRVVGLYAAALSAGFGTGPVLLSITGIDGWPPFLAAAATNAVAGAPLLFVGDSVRDLGREPAGNPLTIASRAPVIFAIVALFGCFESALMALLPVWGVRVGLGETLAASCLTAIYFGAIALQLPIGWLSDKLARVTALRLCAGIGLLGAGLVLLLGGVAVPALFLLLFLWGGFATGIYPVALSMAGERFSASELVTANAAMIIAYGLGAFVGPAVGGVAMDLWNPAGLLALLTLLFAALTALSLAQGGARDPEDRQRI
jgi:MFS family permease